MIEPEARPRALVTREQLEPLGRLLRERGLEPVHAPASTLRATDAPPPVGDAAVVLVSSAAAVRACPGLAAWCHGARVVAVGEATAAALRQAGLEPAAVGEGGGGDALELLGEGTAVFVGAREPAPAVAAALAAGRLTHWAVYERVDDPGGMAAAATAPLAVVLLASPSAARSWAEARPVDVARAPVVVIGETTRAAAEAAGLDVAAVAREPSMVALADAAARIAGA